MKKVITYGTYDLFHEGHRRLLQRAKNLGDYLIVGVTTEAYDETRGKLNVRQSLIERIKQVQESGIADEIIIEEYDGQKINDIQKYGIDIFAIGSDWLGKFDYLNDFCSVVYLERTKGVSSTELRNAEGLLKIGIIGTGRIAKRFVPEARFVSGIDIVGAYSRNKAKLQEFVDSFELSLAAENYDQLLDRVNAVYIATPHPTHKELALKAIKKGKHVLCEKPITLNDDCFSELVQEAKKHNVVLLEAIKTAFCPAFARLIAYAKSGIIGEIKAVDASFTKLTSGNLRELKKEQGGGSFYELGSYPLLAIIKLLGKEYNDIHTIQYKPKGSEVDLYTRVDIIYPHAIGSARTGLGVKSEGDLIISGTEGYIYVPAPWWKTEYFEVRFEDTNKNRKFFYKFDGDGLRYELAHFCDMIRNKNMQTYLLTTDESKWISNIMAKIQTNKKLIK
ncbi:Gfo/Idh/MocA family oxidoreductase [Escherichia coli]|uniref:Gfo/Idh/MocA family oxidoreductase n=1 Tax=Escherichia coli TaxID=562 RepID=UPI000BA9EB77|nr:Gfo/Idh/MocA family oxidoreductase [Escherichia coli]EHH3929666.1 Gfo/Idh/MocA family oxidoreductase [Escherichia coli]MBA0984180.1 Gfo/Idh/MocA family oxidoreductase [Escherichia coli]PAS87706.1 glycerol-3-phosphate cytidylyltransferase [Escherichia coli]HCP4855017.1 Gfo/Idh/MocA family oxidoreductase [Escherichia coli]HDC4236515.1 Gfo/Idh/MocA family oxidoreductase [Escherichia coli]